jgi:hypothetical protein
MKVGFKVLLMGGLGNQFFQIARAIELRDQYVGVQLVYIDAKLDWLYRWGGHTKHESWLDISVLIENLGLKLRPITFAELVVLGFKFILRRLGINTDFDKEIEARLHQKLLPSNSWDIGYFQSIKHVSSTSINKVSMGLADMLKITESPANDRIAFHIRGGDFSVGDRVTVDEVKSAVNVVTSNSSQLFIATNDVNFSSGIFKSLGVDF